MSTPIPSLGNKTPEQLKVAELREELKKRGINVKGLKKDLVERLDEILRQEAETDHLCKKPSPVEVSDEEEETAATPDVLEVVKEPTEGDVEVTVVELKPGFVEVELGESSPVAEVKSGAEEPPLSISLPEADDLSHNDKDVETERLQVIVEELVPASKETVVILEPVGHVAAKSFPESDFQPSPNFGKESALDPDNGADEGKLSESEAKIGSEETGDEQFDSGKLVESENKISSENLVEAELNVDKLPEPEEPIESEQLKLFQYTHPASSTGAVIIEASEALAIPVESALVSEGMRTVAYGDGDIEEVGSVVEETGADPVDIVITEVVTVEAVFGVAETTVVTPETVVINEIEPDLPTAEAEHEGSITQRSCDAGTLIIEGKEKQEPVEEQHIDKDGDAMEIEQDAKVKYFNPMEIDFDSVAGVKRKDGDELRHQEPSKRQRRWNSDKSAGASAPKVIRTDTFKERIGPEARESTQAPVPRSSTTTTSCTPKASGSTNFDKPAPSRPALSRTDIAVNGEVDKKRFVPPPSRAPSVSLKIDRFVRPFTIKAVRELLEQTGTVKEMWMDQIKTHCYVTYSSVEEALATRNALYHLQWPVAGGKLLVAEFAEPEEVKSRVEGVTDKPAATPATTPRGSANSSTQFAGSAGLTPLVAPVPTSALPLPPPLPPPPRERPVLGPKKEQELPIPTLDDLFKKTRTKPQIYFLPLTEEQVADKLRNKQPVGKAPVKA